MFQINFTPHRKFRHQDLFLFFVECLRTLKGSRTRLYILQNYFDDLKKKANLGIKSLHFFVVDNFDPKTH